MIGNGALWAWFLYGNALARALGLLPFKDVFLSPRATATGATAIRTPRPRRCSRRSRPDRSGIGDRVGRTDRELVLRTCRADGVLVKPDVPIAALDRCFRAPRLLEHAPLMARALDARTRRAAGSTSRA